MLICPSSETADRRLLVMRLCAPKHFLSVSGLVFQRCFHHGQCMVYLMKLDMFGETCLGYQTPELVTEHMFRVFWLGVLWSIKKKIALF